jgi:hypothetical protein
VGSRTISAHAFHFTLVLACKGRHDLGGGELREWCEGVWRTRWALEARPTTGRAVSAEAMPKSERTNQRGIPPTLHLRLYCTAITDTDRELKDSRAIPAESRVVAASFVRAIVVSQSIVSCRLECSVP